MVEILNFCFFALDLAYETVLEQFKDSSFVCKSLLLLVLFLRCRKPLFQN